MWEAKVGTIYKMSLLLQAQNGLKKKKNPFVEWHFHACHLENLMRGKL